MPKKTDRFDDKTLLSTPNPIHSSSMTEPRAHRSSFPRPSDIYFDNKKLDFSVLSERLQRERSLAATALSRLDSIHDGNLVGLPSRFLRPSELSNSSGNLQRSAESTISESDLVLSGNTSTPRESMADEVRQTSRASRGSSICQLAHSMKDTTFNLDDIVEQLREAMSMGEQSSFCSGSEVLERLAKDEESWKQEKDIPAVLEEFSIAPYDSKQLSMGSFFKQRSDNLSTVLAKSPEKVQKPVPLIDVSTINETNNSLSLSAIAKVLSDTSQTPNKATNYFLNSKRKTDNFDRIVEDKEEECRRSRSPINRNSPSLDLYSSEENSKENINILNVRESAPSSLSSRSPSALSSLPSGKLPIATTKVELIWGCIKQGKIVSESFVIKNKSSSRVGVICTVSNPSFRLFKDGYETNSSSMMKIILHPHETRSLGVSFTPTALGAVSDRLQFTPMNSTHNQAANPHIKLFGYGGHTNVVVNNTVRDTMGRFMVSLGDINDSSKLKKNITLKNVGTLPSFVQIIFTTSGFGLSSDVGVEPKELVLLPEEQREVAITIILNKDDLDDMRSNPNCVIDIGKLIVTSGTEADRGRLRRLQKKAMEKNLTTKFDIEHLVKSYPGEVMPSDLKLMKESPQAIGQIFKCMHRKEIIVTVERDLDRTLVPELQNETAMFNSLCEESELTVFESTFCTNTCSIEPSKIYLKHPNKISDMIFVSNNSKRQVSFKVYSNPEGLQMKPKNGSIGAGETSIIELVYDKVCKNSCVFKVKIVVENEVYDVAVKVLF